MHYFCICICSIMVMPSLAGYEDEKPFDSAWEEVSLYAGSTPAICTIFLFGGEVLANTENLVSLADRTTEEQRAIASAGGKASGEARRKRKTLKEELLLMLSDGNIQEKISLALINEAINGNNAGSVTKAFEVIRDTIGERPVEKVQATQTVVDMSAFSTEEIKAMLDEEV